MLFPLKPVLYFAQKNHSLYYFFFINPCMYQLFFVPLEPKHSTINITPPTIMAIKTTELIRTSQSWDGAILPDFPNGKPELRITRTDFPVGAKTGWHHHTVVNYGIVQQGELTIVCQDGSEKTFREGEPLVEVVGTIHRGENRGTKPVILNMFYFSEPGQEITIQHPELENEQKAVIPSTVAEERLTPISKEEARIQKLVLALGKQTLPRRQIVAELNLRQKSRKVFIDNYLKPAQAKGYITYAFPAHPSLPEQAYRLTAKGLDLYVTLTISSQKDKT